MPALSSVWTWRSNLIMSQQPSWIFSYHIEVASKRKKKAFELDCYVIENVYV